MSGRSDNENESPDLFGLTEEERQRHRLAGKRDARKPSFAKIKKLAPTASKKKLAIIAAPILGCLLVLCLPVNAARCLTAAGQMLSDCKSYDAAIGACNLALSLNPASADAYCVRAAANDDCQRYDQAIADYNRAVLIDPKMTPAYLQRGMSLYKTHDYKGAIADFGQTIKAEPGNAVAYVRRGIARSRLGEYDAAVADYDQATKIDPTNTEAMYNRGWAQDLQYDETMEKGAPADVAVNEAQHTQLSKQVTALSQQLEGAKTDPQLYCDRGLACLKLRKLKEAIADFDAAISLNPKFASAYVNRGSAYSSLKQYSKAIADYTACVAIAPQNPSAYYRRGLADDLSGNYKSAITDYKMAAQLNPSRAAQYAVLETADARRLGLANNATTKLATNKAAPQPSSAATNQAAPAAVASQPPKTSAGSSNLALSTASKESSSKANEAAVPVDTRSATEHLRAGKDLINQNKHGQAAAEFSLGLQAAPRNTDLALLMHRELGVDAYLRGEYPLAVKELNIAAAIHTPVSSYFYKWRSFSYHRAGDDKQALADANEALRLKPNDKEVYGFRQALYKDLGQQDPATKEGSYVDGALVRNAPPSSVASAGQSTTVKLPGERQLPGNPDKEKSLSDDLRSHWQQAQHFDLNDQPEHALREYKIVLDANPETRICRSIHHAMGDIYAKEKDYDNALAHYDLAISMRSRDSHLFRGRGAVYGKLGQWQKALDDFNTSIEISPSHAFLYHERSKAYEAIGRKDLAAADAQKASDLGFVPGKRRKDR